MCNLSRLSSVAKVGVRQFGLYLCDRVGVTEGDVDEYWFDVLDSQCKCISKAEITRSNRQENSIVLLNLIEFLKSNCCY